MTAPDSGFSPELRRPLSVLVVVYTRDARILLLERVQPFAFWQSVTGSLQDGEEHTHAAARELEEETGLTGEGELSYSGVSRRFVIDPRWVSRFAPGVTENVEYEWRYRLEQTQAIVLDRSEHSGYRWMAIDEAIDAVWSWTNREALASLKDTL